MPPYFGIALLCFSCLVTLALLAAPPAVAQDETSQMSNEEASSGGMWMLGLGVGVFDTPYAGVDTSIIPLPLVTYVGERFTAYMGEASYSLLEHDPWSVALMAEVRFGGYDDDDSDALSGMDDRHLTLELGASLSHEAPWGTLTLAALTDVLGIHEGQEVRLTYSINLGPDYLQIMLQVGVSWKSSDLIDYYYGVTASEARPGRPAYEPGSSVNLSTSLTVQMFLSRHWSLFGSVGIEWLGNEITDSPIVEDDRELTVVAGLSYMF